MEQVEMQFTQNLDCGVGLCTHSIIKKELHSPYSLNKILQILSVGIFEKMPINQAFTQIEMLENSTTHPKQLILFDS